MAIQLHTETTSLHDAIIERLGDLERRRQHRHELRILTCYVDFDAVRRLIIMVANEIKLTNAKLMFEFSEIYRRRTPTEAAEALRELKEICLKHSVDFTWGALKAGSLMHAKAYALLQYKEGKLEDGYVWVTSGNATVRGLGQDTPNFEISSVTHKVSDLKGFLRVWDVLTEDYTVSIDRPVASSNEYGFKFGLLASGIFLHKWTMPLSAQLALRYTMTARGCEMARQTPEELTRLGFELDVKTLSRQPLRFSATKVLPKGVLEDVYHRHFPRPLVSTLGLGTSRANHGEGRRVSQVYRRLQRAHRGHPTFENHCR